MFATLTLLGGSILVNEVIHVVVGRLGNGVGG
jgi:hypothetical protein